MAKDFKLQQWSPREGDILKGCTEWLDAFGWLWWRMPLGPVVHTTKNRGIVWKANPLKGFPDLAGIVKGSEGRFWACEVKTKTGRLTEEQRDWASDLQAAGVLVITARSIDEMVFGLLEAQRKTSHR